MGFKSLSSTPKPFSSYSERSIQKLSLSFMMSARTEPPRKTMCLRRGGSSIRILNFCTHAHIHIHTHTWEWFNNADVALVLHISLVRNSYRMSPIVPSLLQFSPTQTHVGHLSVRHTFIVQLHETHAMYKFIHINFLILLKASHQPVTTQTLKQFLSLKKHKGERANLPKRLFFKNPHKQLISSKILRT